ncbi:MAG: hypothetical protein ACOCTN_03960 [Candidatus Natronoplasma sp.]
MIEFLPLLGLVSIIALNMGWGLQLFQVIKTKQTRDLSLMFLIVAFISFLGLQTYTVFEVGNVVYIIGNSIGITFVGILLVLKLKY